MTAAAQHELARKTEALNSVRRLVRTGNNKSYWRKREAELTAEIERLKAAGGAA